MLKADGLKAGVVYYDGQFNDARMAVTLALTAQKNGAVIANHVEALALLKDQGKICGARVRDSISGEQFDVLALLDQGDVQSITLRSSAIADRYALDGESVFAELLEIVLGCIFQPNVTDGAFDDTEFRIQQMNLLLAQ